MWPTIISMGPVSIHSFGVFLFLGLFFGSFSLWRRSREEGWEETAVMDIWLLAGAAALVAGRIGYVGTHWPDFNFSWYKMLFLTKFPGLSALTAWLGAILVFAAAAFKKRLPFWIWLESIIPALLLVEIFGNFASFLSGSNLGKPSPSGWGLAFPGVPEARWPVQLFWVAGLFLIYVLIRYWEKHYRSFGWKEGVLVAVYLVAGGILRLGLGFLEESPAALKFLSAILMIIAGALILFFRSSITIKAPVKNKTLLKRKRRFDYA